MKKIILFALITLTVSACGNTMNGAGRDLEKMGQSIQKTF